MVAAPIDCTLDPGITIRKSLTNTGNGSCTVHACSFRLLGIKLVQYKETKKWSKGHIVPWLARGAEKCYSIPFMKFLLHALDILNLHHPFHLILYHFAYLLFILSIPSKWFPGKPIFKQFMLKRL